MNLPPPPSINQTEPFFLSNFKTSMKAPANSSTLQIKPSDYGLSMNENGNLRLFWSKIMIQLVAYTFECYYWTHFISQIIQKCVSHTGTYGYKFNSQFLWKKNYYPVLMRENGSIKQDKRIEITKKKTNWKQSFMNETLKFSHNEYDIVYKHWYTCTSSINCA